MQIKILDSWLREYLKTNAKPEVIARELSLTSVSVERIEKVGDDFLYDIEVTTNRPDLMSVRGIANEAALALNQENISAKFEDKSFKTAKTDSISFPIQIDNDPKLVNRIMAAVIEVEIGKSPKEISDRLEKSDIRSLNNLIDVTNYVMREIGHPAHVFDYDRLNTKKLIIRESKKGEKLTTLDKKNYLLTGGDIVADNGKGEIVDLLGVMGTANSVVTNDTKRILYFLDNNNPGLIRKTSMNLGIRTEAAVINEKGIDPELMEVAFKYGIELYEKHAKGKVIAKTFDTYPNSSKKHEIEVEFEKINKVIGVEIEPQKSKEILENLGFDVILNKEKLTATVPTIRSDEVKFPEDIIEEIARIYGYHKLPSIIPAYLSSKNSKYADDFYFQNRIKEALKYWGFTEVYTYSMVSEEMYIGDTKSAVKIKNPLSEEMLYMRNSLIPSLIQVADENKSRDEIKVFELANLYIKRDGELPDEKLMLSGIIKKEKLSFFEVKGIIEQLLVDLGIENYKFKSREEGGAVISIGKNELGYVEILGHNLIDFELSFEIILKHATVKKIYKPLTKFPPIIEDMTFVLDESIATEDVIEEIKLQSFLIQDVSLKDQFENSKTFHIIYQSNEKNLTTGEIKEIRDQITKFVKKKFNAELK